MATFRIGKNERWILTHCYMKTVNKKLPANWLLPRGFLIPHKGKSVSIEDTIAYVLYRRKLDDATKIKEANNLGLIFWLYLYKSEILLNYFGLPLSYYKSTSEYELKNIPEAEYFRGYGVHVEDKGYPNSMEQERNFAFVTYSNTIKTLLNKDLIEVFKGSQSNSDAIRLTDLGIDKAKGC